MVFTHSPWAFVPLSPDRALNLPTFSHLSIVNKTSLSLSLSLDLAATVLLVRWAEALVTGVRGQTHKCSEARVSAEDCGL